MSFYIKVKQKETGYTYGWLDVNGDFEATPADASLRIFAHARDAKEWIKEHSKAIPNAKFVIMKHDHLGRHLKKL
jgi:hypothetical protein